MLSKPVYLVTLTVFLGIKLYSQNTFNKELFPFQFFNNDTVLLAFGEPRMYQDSASGNLCVNYTGTIWDGYQQKQGVGIAKLDSLGNFLNIKHIVHPKDTQLAGYRHIPLIRNDSIYFLDYTVQGRIAYLNVVDTHFSTLKRIKIYSDLTKWGWRRQIDGRLAIKFQNDNHLVGAAGVGTSVNDRFLFEMNLKGEFTKYYEPHKKNGQFFIDYKVGESGLYYMLMHLPFQKDQTFN